MHGDETLEHIMKQRELKQPEKWPQFQVRSLESESFKFDDSQINSETKIRRRREESDSQRYTHARSTSSFINPASLTQSGSSIKYEDPVQRSSIRGYNESHFKHNSILQIEDSVADSSEQYSPKICKPLRKTLSTPRLQSETHCPTETDQNSVTKTNTSSSRMFPPIPANSFLITIQKLATKREHESPLKQESNRHIRELVSLSDTNRGVFSQKCQILKELENKDASFQRTLKVLKIPELLSPIKNFRYQLDEAYIRPHHTVQSTTNGLSYNDRINLGMGSTKSTTLETTLPRVTRNLFRSRRLQPHRPLNSLERTEGTLSKINLSFDPTQNSIDEPPQSKEHCDNTKKKRLLKIS